MSKKSTKHHLIRPRIVSAWFTLVGVLLLSSIVPVACSAASGISQGFTTTKNDSSIVPGTILELLPDSKTEVTPATPAKQYRLVGVAADQPLVALNDGTNRVQVTMDGTAPVFVSNINGSVKAGDHITISPILGVGMKATTSGEVVGVAQESLADTTTTTRSIVDKSGKKHTVKIGKITIRVSTGYYAGNDSGVVASIVPPFMLSFAAAVVGRHVSAVRVLFGVFALLIGFGIAAIMLRTGIRSGLISIGRNPLAKRSIRRELLDVCLTATGVMLLTVMVVYVVLRI